MRPHAYVGITLLVTLFANGCSTGDCGWPLPEPAGELTIVRAPPSFDDAVDGTLEVRSADVILRYTDDSGSEVVVTFLVDPRDE